MSTTKTKATDITGRIAVRAYYLWLAGTPGGAVSHWLAAEAIETAYAERRAAAASKAAVTRRANAAYEKVVVFGPEMLTASRRPATRRPTAH